MMLLLGHIIRKEQQAEEEGWGLTRWQLHSHHHHPSIEYALSKTIHVLSSRKSARHRPVRHITP